MINIINPLIQVFMPSAATIILGYILDFTLSRNTLLYYFENKAELYISGIISSFINLLIIAPINYVIAYNFLFVDKMLNGGLNLYKLFFMLLTHNILYYVLHMSVHKYPNLRFIHDFHHKFIINLPSIGNAVSIYEFQFMYILPFLVGLYFIKPNILTFNLTIYTISLFNLIIHSDELKNKYWLKIFVSPNQHCKHHHNYYGNYSAPLLNFDYLKKKIDYLF